MELNDILFAKLAGWEAVKTARTLLAGGRVLASEWEPPHLKGQVQEGSTTYRAGLIIRSASDAENLCPCRDSRQRGMICAHSVAVGLHYVKSRLPAAPAASAATTPGSTGRPAAAPAAPARPAKPVNTLRRSLPSVAGEPLELSLILPPNFSEALARGKVMLYWEGHWRAGRAPLNAVPRDLAFTLSPADTAILEALEALNGGEAPAMMMLDAPGLANLLPLLTGHPRVTLGKADAISISAEPLRLPVVARLEPNGEITLRVTGAIPAGLLRGAVAWVLLGRTLRPLGLPAGMEGLLTDELRLPRLRVPQFMNVDWPRLAEQCDLTANFDPADFVLETARPRFRLQLTGGLAMLDAKLECLYGNDRVTPGLAAATDALWLPDPASPLRYGTRDIAAEQAALQRLQRSGFLGPDAAGLLHIRGQNPVLDFFAREFPRLEREWEVTLEERLDRSTRQNLERIEPRFQITPSGEQWFDLNVAYKTTGGEQFAPADIQRLLLSGQSHTRLKNGKFALLDTGAVEELQEVLLDCAPRQHAAGYRLDNRQAGFLDATLRAQTTWQVQAPAAWSQRSAQQRGEVKVTALPLGPLESVLRPYQKEGVAWLSFLRSNHFGGILADEMGLGKTLQVLALVNSLRSSAGTGARRPWLIVCPTSLVFNWAAEAAKFTPDLRVLALHGPRRQEQFATVPSHDLVITSYSLLRRDAEAYRSWDFETVVLDEAQHIKNRQTQNAQAVKAIRAAHRLVLTGTPLENSVLDLWSIFDFLMPGYLGVAADFRERYEIPIVREKNAAAQSRLARRLRPFLLRRLKREVAQDLPEKIEQVSYCELGAQQRALYQQVLEAGRQEIQAAADASAAGKGRMLALTTLLRLRQICCDARLLAAGLGDRPLEPSGKVELFGELLEEILDGGHRVLVFSQFTSMLDLLREELQARELTYCYLDGSTRDRAGEVAKFQRDAGIPVFLISLKAGGVGLNLTGADTVIHFDPWWNPAVEAQATDRAHRIGQRNVVTSYKLIARDTVEEKILQLQSRKRALFAGMLAGEEQLTGALSWDEIQDLLAG